MEKICATAATAPDADYTFGYHPDSLRFATETVTIDPDGSDPLPSLTRTIDRSRDQLQRPAGYQLKTENLTLETSIGYGYDVSGRLATISAQGLPNLPGKTHAFEYAYEPGSSLLDKVTGPVHEVDNTYETHRNVLLQKKNTRTVGTPGELSVIGYTVNEIGQRVQRNLSGEIRAEFYGGQAADLYPTDWGYDALGQVTSEDKPSTTADRGYSYDQIGNRLTSTADSVTTSYSSNALNQYSEINNQQSAIVNPVHDADGNMTTGLLNGSTTGQFEYDGGNQLIRTQTTATADPTRYAYDAFGRRIGKVTYPNAGGTATAATVFIYDGWNLIAEYKLESGAWSLNRTYTWGIDLSGTTQGAGGVGGLLAVRLLSPVSGSSVFFPCLDGNGNIEAYLDSNGAPAAIYQYDAFGNFLSGGGKGATIEQAKFAHRFSTKYQDAETGLLYYGYRYYDAPMGRWINRDPIGESGGVNLVVFLSNDPIGKVDIFGLASKTYHHWMPTQLLPRIQETCPGLDHNLITTGYGPGTLQSGTPHHQIHHALVTRYNFAYASMLASLRNVPEKYRCCVMLMATEVMKNAVHAWLQQQPFPDSWVSGEMPPPVVYYPWAPNNRTRPQFTDTSRAWKRTLIKRCACVPPEELEKHLRNVSIPLQIQIKPTVPEYLVPENPWRTPGPAQPELPVEVIISTGVGVELTKRASPLTVGQYLKIIGTSVVAMPATVFGALMVGPSIDGMYYNPNDPNQTF